MQNNQNSTWIEAVPIKHHSFPKITWMVICESTAISQLFHCRPVSSIEIYIYYHHFPVKHKPTFHFHFSHSSWSLVKISLVFFTRILVVFSSNLMLVSKLYIFLLLLASSYFKLTYAHEWYTPYGNLSVYFLLTVFLFF